MPLIRSWVESANSPDTDFPLNNLPLGVFTHPDTIGARCGVAIGDQILDATGLEAAGLLSLSERPVLAEPAWNALMACGPRVWADLRAQLTSMLSADASARPSIEPFLHPITAAKLHLPFSVVEYTDFYASLHHATNVGTMFRGADNALPANWLHIPIGYNGRASSVVVSGTDIRRPWGQLKTPETPTPYFAPSARFDFELELGAIVGQPSHGPITVAEADDMIFGYVLLNDWSARDIQAWEYQPLGPFQSKASATTLSPWIVMRAALEPFRVSAPARMTPLLPHLTDDGPMHYDIDLEVSLVPEGREAVAISRTNARELYYSAAQQLAHHASSGCPMRVGDLLGSGTISGPHAGNRGSLLELSWGGKTPIDIGGVSRSFLEDGDTLTLRGAAMADGYRIGFGPCSGRVLPALNDPYAR